MLPRPTTLAPLALGLFLSGCGGDPREEAPGVGTVAALAQAPPNAVGYDVDRPPPPKATTTAKPPTPIRPGGKPKPHSELEMPDDPPKPPGGGAPQKGTDL